MQPLQSASGIDVVGAAPASLGALDVSGIHDGYEETHVPAARHPIKSLVFTSQKASFAVHMASSNVSLVASESRFSTSKNSIDQVECPRTPYLNPIQLATHALGARHALPQHHDLASKDSGANIIVPLVLLSSLRARGGPAYTCALSHARSSANPTPGFSSPDFNPICSSSASSVRHARSTVPSAHPATAILWPSEQRFETAILPALESF